MYSIIIHNKKEDRWHFFTNEFWLTEREAIAYAKQNKFKKSTPWKVVLYDKKYKIYSDL